MINTSMRMVHVQLYMLVLQQTHSLRRTSSAALEYNSFTRFWRDTSQYVGAHGEHKHGGYPRRVCFVLDSLESGVVTIFVSDVYAS